MKRNTIIALIAVLNLFLTAIVWVKWGGYHNDMGTLVLLSWLVFSGCVLLDHTEKNPKKVKED